MAEVKKQFADNLRILEGGEFVEDAADDLRALNAYLSEHAAANGKASGEITIKIKLHHVRGAALTIESDITVKKPKVKRAPTAAWLTPQNDLSRSDPRQMEIASAKVDIPRRVAGENE